MKFNNELVLVGLGKIGYRGFPQTHYKCAIANKMNIVAGIDSSIQARNRFTSETGIPSYPSLDQLPDNLWNSFYSVASSTESSFEILNILLERKWPKAILAEKPFCNNAFQSAQILNLQRECKIPLRINYSRQYSQAMSKIKSLIANRKLISGVVIYSSGLKENGSHFVRLVCGLFPTAISLKKINWVDESNFSLQIENDVNIRFVHLHSPKMHNSEIKLVFDEFLISINEGHKIDIRSFDNLSQIRLWPRELKIIYESDFSDGFNASYSNQNWWKFPNQEIIYSELELDHFSNLLIEAFNNQDNDKAERIYSEESKF